MDPEGSFVRLLINICFLNIFSEYYYSLYKESERNTVYTAIVYDDISRIIP
jgi:hypothetical protein